MLEVTDEQQLWERFGKTHIEETVHETVQETVQEELIESTEEA